MIKFILYFAIFLDCICTFTACKKASSGNHNGNSNNNANAIPVDADGNAYDTIRIGTQVWMKENLKTSHFQDGSPILEVEDSLQWNNIFNNCNGTQTAAWCDLNADHSNDAIYGKLYNFYAVNDPKNLCPVGWHVPSEDEANMLFNYLGGTNEAGASLKAVSGLWISPNVGATNSTGFSALPGGCRYTTGGFLGLAGHFAYFWCSTPDGSICSNIGGYNCACSWSWQLYNEQPNAIINPNIWQNDGCSVRCVRDY